MAMFRKSSHGDVKKSAQKVADPKKDSYTRLKHLKTVLESYDTQEAKTFFEGNYSHIYYIFYDVFVCVETDLKQRANKAHREELESILHIFEKILLLLPELIHKRWMFHSIGGIMKKLLHPGNSVKLRREGTRLFIIWYQVLQENASDECHQIYLSLVTGLGDTDLLDVINKSVAEMHGGIIAAGEITPLLPGTGEKLPDNLSKYFLEAVLTFMVSEVVRVEWLNKEMREAGFVFLFDKFKASYLNMLLPNFDHSRSIYEPQLDLPETRPLKELLSNEVTEDVSACQDLFVRWIANFAITMKKADSSSPVVVKSAAAEESTENTEDKVDNPDQMPGSQTSTLSNGSQSTEKDSVDTSIGSDDHSMSEYEIVRSVLYSTRENVSIVQEVFRQALMFSLHHASAIKRVIGVYKDWFQHAEQRPIFMHEPCVSCTSVNHQGIPDFFHSLSDIIEESSSDESPASSTPRHTLCLEPPLDASLRVHSTARNASYLGAVEDLADSGDSQLSHLDVRAGLQKVLQIFITNAANVFLLDVDTDEEMLSEQVDLCKRVLSIFRHIVMNMPLQQQTWEQILKILLCITGGVLKTHPPKDRSSTLGGRLAQPIFQTLIVTWIKANLNVYISATLWDQFLQVLSSLTRWEELIKEWAKTMETLTRVLARQVYGLDLNDLPLHRLSEQKEKRRRGRDQSNYGHHHKSQAMDKTFSHAILSAKITPPTGGVSAPALDMPFERERGKYKSDGAGGKIRSDGSKVTSSGDPSPTHSRSASNSSDHVPILRSSSEGNLATGESRLKGASFCSDGVAKSDTYCISSEATGAASDDREVACATLGIIPLDSWSVASADSVLVAGADRSGASGHLFEQSGDNTSIDKSEYDNVTRSSRTPSPVSVDYKEGSRTPSPTQELPCDVHNKDCPTPDRDSLHIDALASVDESIVRQESADGLESELELKSVLRGGDVQGWLPDVAVVLWKRMLCSLGNVNKMDDPVIHATVFDHLGAILDTLLKIRDNLSVTSDNTSTPSPPELVPPRQLFSAWFFQALKLGVDYKAGKLLAYQFLSNMLVRCHDVSLSPTVLSQLYKVLHHGLTSCDQDVTNVLVRHCGIHFFQTLLPGSTLLMQDFIRAAQSIITSTDISCAPRSDAVALLGSLLCFPNHYRHVPVVIEPSPRHLSMMICTDTKDRIVSLLLHAGKQEPLGQARYLAVYSLGVYLYEELHHNTLHSALKDAINVILADLRCLNKIVAKASTDMLLLLCDHVDKLFSYTPQLPKKIIEVLACNISALIPATGSSSSEVDRQLLISMMFCMVEWCMRMPLSLLLETTDSDKSSVYKVFKVLNAAVAGQTTPALSRSLYMSFVDSTADTEFLGLRDLKLPSSVSPAESPSDAPTDRNVVIESLSPSPSLQSTSESSATLKTEATNVVQLAARMLLCHLVNHLGHFPMGSRASRLHSNIQEFHDNPDAGNLDDLTPEIFQAPNTQFFVLNQRTLISFLELPAQLNMPGGGVTAGLTTAKTVCRVLVRDLSGKFCWDSAVLYGPPWCTKSPNNSFLQDTSTSSVLTVPSDFDLEPLIVQDDLNVSIDLPKRPVSQLPMHTNIQHNDDNLDHLLGYIGHTSAECHLIPGVALNIPAPLPEEVNNCAEDTLTDMVLTQKDEEIIFYSRHKSDIWMLAPPLQPQESQDPVSAFHMCRTMLNQLGLLSWEKRCHFDLLKKSDKLLRELKHLDSQKCRETHKFAVIYVARGQEDKCSVLANTGGSKVYEDFVAGLGWEVELETHQGFIGGLQQNKTTGDTAPYYATSTLEIIFHVSTRMPFGTDEAMHRKMRHLGNDEVHIIWSEHDRDYRRGIIPTEFGDVIIVIYPLSNGLFRIQINKKPEIPNFGPLFDGAIVDRQVLPGLVRATAVNAGRVKRTLIPFYHPYYEERSKCLDTIIATHSYPTMFEEFAANIFAPVLPQSKIVDKGAMDMPSSVSGSDLVRSASSQLSSPSVTRSTRENEAAIVASTAPPPSLVSVENVAASYGIVARTAKRLSMKTRRSSNSRPLQSPPGSPKNNGKTTSSKKARHHSTVTVPQTDALNRE